MDRTEKWKEWVQAQDKQMLAEFLGINVWMLNKYLRSPMVLKVDFSQKLIYASQGELTPEDFLVRFVRKRGASKKKFFEDLEKEKIEYAKSRERELNEYLAELSRKRKERGKAS